METEKDSTLQSLIKAIETDHWTDFGILDYKRLKDELLVYSGVVLRGNRIVVPSKLRDRSVELAHVGHQGIVKTKRLIREKVWFPGIEKMVKDKVNNCLAPQAVTPSKSSRSEPLQMTPLPSGFPWISLDHSLLVTAFYWSLKNTATSQKKRSSSPHLPNLSSRSLTPYLQGKESLTS